MRPLCNLIDTDDSAWPLINEWLLAATNPYEILSADTDKANHALHQLQVTTRSPMGAVVYQTGGILIDNGWLRIAGCGHLRLPRHPAGWMQSRAELLKYQALPVADDVAGGLFAINGGGLGDDTGNIYYFAPDSLKWESLEVGYSHFLQWALIGDLDLFYNNVRWEGWQTEVKALSGEFACHFYPFLWTSSETPRSRRIVPVTEIWDQQQDVIRQLLA